MKRNLVVPGILAIAMSILLSACGSESDSESAATPKPVARSEAKAMKDPIERMARAVGGGKPGAAVDIKYEFQSKPDVGKPVELELALIPSSGVGSMDITVAGMEGISLTGALTHTFD